MTGGVACLSWPSASAAAWRIYHFPFRKQPGPFKKINSSLKALRSPSMTGGLS